MNRDQVPWRQCFTEYAWLLPPFVQGAGVENPLQAPSCRERSFDSMKAGRPKGFVVLNSPGKTPVVNRSSAVRAGSSRGHRRGASLRGAGPCSKRAMAGRTWAWARRSRGAHHLAKLLDNPPGGCARGRLRPDLVKHRFHRPRSPLFHRIANEIGQVQGVDVVG